MATMPLRIQRAGSLADRAASEAVRVGDTSDRGYGAAHQAERKRWEPKVRAGGVYCARQGPKCVGQPIDPDQPWDLGHTDDRTAWTGPECVPCNRGAGGANGRAVQLERAGMTIREW